jgi:ArsR family transcriptional regulator
MPLVKRTTEQLNAIEADHQQKVDAVRKRMKSEELFESLSETFKALGDHTRVKIIYVLAQEELCVNCIAKILDMSESAISHQLRILRTMKIVKHRREGKLVYYSLDDDHIRHLLDASLEHVEHE